MSLYEDLSGPLFLEDECLTCGVAWPLEWRGYCLADVPTHCPRCGADLLAPEPKEHP